MTGRPPRFLAVAATCAALLPAVGGAQTLRGSPASVARQRDVAVQHDLSFLETAAEISQFVKLGFLVPLSGDANYQTVGVSYPFGRAAVRLFVERVAAQYKAACGEPLTVTSLTRPAAKQPRNASPESVHPAGMAVDLRVSNNAVCRRWLEKTLLTLEKSSVVEATRERRPPHYHVAVFPARYTAYLDSIAKPSASRTVNSAPSAPSPKPASRTSR